jgi:hypothetical protein
MAMFNSPDYKAIKYLLNPHSGRYEKQPSKLNFQKLPYELKVETTQDQRIKSQGAETIITGRFVNKKREFFSGMRRTEFPNWYHGNDYEFLKGEKVNSLVIFEFSGNDSELTVYYFNRYYKHSATERESFINYFIGRLLN